MNTLFLLLKFVHVIAVIVWVGGMAALVSLNARIARGGVPAAIAALGQQSDRYGNAVIGPAMLVVLLAGLATAGSAGYPFSSPWIVWGLIGFVGASVLTGGVIPRTVRALSATAQRVGPDDPQVAALGRRLSILNALNLILLLSVVWAMVFKPTR